MSHQQRVLIQKYNDLIKLKDIFEYGEYSEYFFDRKKIRFKTLVLLSVYINIVYANIICTKV